MLDEMKYISLPRWWNLSTHFLIVGPARSRFVTKTPRTPEKKKKKVQRVWNVFIRNKRGDSGLTRLGVFISLPVGVVAYWHPVMKSYDKNLSFPFCFVSEQTLNILGYDYFFCGQQQPLWTHSSRGGFFTVWQTESEAQRVHNIVHGDL